MPLIFSRDRRAFVAQIIQDYNHKFRWVDLETNLHSDAAYETEEAALAAFFNRNTEK